MSAPASIRQPRLLAVALALAAAGSVHAASLGNAPYLQTFDSMGQSGTSAPEGWRVFTGPSGTSNSTWTTSISPADVAALQPAAGSLSATTAPGGTNNNGFNAAVSPADLSDRVLATSPTTTSGGALQLTLNNDTGAALTGLSLSFDTVRYTSTTSANELPGYWLFYSLDGSHWLNVPALNGDGSSVPNSAGVSQFAGSFDFVTPVATGDSVLLRWVDDNARQTSPDQIIGLNNLSVSAVPEPSTVALWLAGLAGLVAARKRRP